jgi:hypothetical protein
MEVADCLSRDTVDHLNTEDTCPRCIEMVNTLRDIAYLHTIQEVLLAQQEDFGDAMEYIKSNGGCMIDD